MKHFYTLAIAGLISLSSYAQVDRISIYFNPGTSELDDDSRHQMSHLKQAFDNFEIQIIELESFSDNIQPSAALKESNARTELVVKELSLAEEPVSISNWGRQRPELHFMAEGWDRVDVYYHKSPVLMAQQSFKKPEKEELAAPAQVALVNQASVASLDEEIVAYIQQERKQLYTKEFIYNPDMGETDAVVLPILFVGNKAIIKKRSTGYLEQLYQLLDTQEDLTIHIRGHVCCGNRKSLSRRRAKAVYRELKTLGISKDRMSYKGYGNKEPFVFPERSSHDRSLNRRVDVIFTSKNSMAQNTHPIAK